MDLSPYLNSLREDLNAAASAGDENTKRAAAVLSAALEPAARLAIMSALSDLADEVTAQLDNTVVDVRLSGRDVRVVVDTRESRERGEPHGGRRGHPGRRDPGRAPHGPELTAAVTRPTS